MVLARLRGDEAVEGGDSILVKERDVCSALGLLSRACAASSDDMAFFNVALAKAQVTGVVVMMQLATNVASSTQQF